jgi:exonuclease III
MANQEPLEIISHNANGLANAKNRKSLFGWLKKLHNAKEKIVFLQETHSVESNASTWKTDWGNCEVYFSHGENNSRGVAIIMPDSLNGKIQNIKRSQNGRYIAINTIINEKKFCLINCYAPNTVQSRNQLKWLEEIQKILEENNDSNIIVGGDLNDVFIPQLDRYRCKPRAVETDYVKEWKTLCEDYNLVDIWRMLNPDRRCYTWRQGRSALNLKQSRLDYWLVSAHMTYDLQYVDINSSARSDHSLITIGFFKTCVPDRGPSFWHFNANLLKDHNYVKLIKEKFGTASKKYETLQDKGLKWDVIKMELRSSTICFSKNKAKENRDKIKEKMIEVDNLEKQLSKEPSDALLQKYNEGKKQIEDYNNDKANGVIVRAKVDWAEYGEKNTKFFLNLEKRNYNMKCITKLVTEEDKEISNADDILKYEEHFYKTLYSDPADVSTQTRLNASNVFLDETTPKISENHKQMCECDITVEEAGKALKQLQNGKSPGSDGFTTDFYKFFWCDIKNSVIDSINYAKNIGKLSIDQKRGIINLIPKKNKDPRLLKNWRPISLLNTDYKIITKVLASRLKEVLPSVINSDQVAYLKKRFIGQNIRTIFDILDYTKLKDENGIIAFLDFEKAFDTINWKAIFDALTSFNLGPSFIGWVHTIYNDSEACVTNNGYSSAFFKLERGVRQGCPLSAYLFIMVVELLANQIRKSENIRGIKIGNTEIKLVQMADDTTTFVEDVNSLENIFKLLETFRLYAGLKLNKSKTEAMWLGRDMNNDHSPLDIKWVKQVHSLGIFFSYDTDSVVQKNFMDRAKEFKRILDLWLQRDLSLLGKITILKSLAFSKIIYQCGVIACPSKFIEQVNNMAYNFIWNYKPNKIKRKTLIAEYEKGGLRMLDIKSFLKAQKVMWAKRLLQPGQASWKAFPLLLLDSESLLGINTLKCNLSCKEQPENFPDFYWQIIQSWNEVKSIANTVESPFDIRNQWLWLNKQILINKEEVNWKEWHEQGINIIHDIIHEDGSFLTPNEIKDKYDITCDIFNYGALKDAIPEQWRKKIKKMKIPNEAISAHQNVCIKVGKIDKDISQITNKEIYWILVRSIQEKPIIVVHLKNEFGIQGDDWEKVFTIPRVIRNSRIRAFQYKILYNLIPCNLYLKRISRSDTDKCSACQELDTIVHYFCECQQAKYFWNSFIQWWNGVYNTELFLNNSNIMLGITENAVKNEVINACLLLAKWSIYRTKLNDSPIFFYNYLCDLKYHLMIEKTIALRNNKLEIYDKMWSKIEDELT